MIGFQELMLEQGLKTKEVESKIGVKQGAVAGWYSSKVPKRHLKFLAEMFNVKEDYLNKKVNDIDTHRSRTKGFNHYEIIGEDTKIFVIRNDGIKVEFIVDTDELQKLIELNQPWNATYDEFIDNYYGVSTLYYYESGERKQRSIRLHEVIMGEKYIDHINHDSKDNRKINLRKIEQDNNLKNRKSKNSNNKSGFRNVSWHKKDNKWVVQLQIKGKNKILKRFPLDQLEEAGAYAEEMRQLHYGEFAGKS